MRYCVQYKMYKLLFLSCLLMVFSCSSDNDPPTMPAADPDPDACVTSRNIEPCESPPASDQTLQVLGAEASVSGVIAEGERHIYQIPSDANLSLYSTSGNADIFLFDELEDIGMGDIYDNSNTLCRSSWGFKEDVCIASADDEDMFVLVYGAADSDYRLSTTAECSVQAMNGWVYRSMRDFYLYADEVPEVDLEGYSDPADLVEDLRFEDLDPFSSLRNAAAQSGFFEEGIAFGFGYNARRDEDDNLTMLFTYENSPIGMAGIKRGDIAVSINGEIEKDITDERYSELVGTRENPLPTTWEFIDGETRETKSVVLTRAEYRINTVLHSEVISPAESTTKIGYLVLKSFIEPTRDELDVVIESFKNQGVTELVLDLRYNGGGRVRVGRRFAAQLAGVAINGQIESTSLHNNTYREFDFSRVFNLAEPSLDLSRVIVLTTDRTASMSERLVNSLRPYIEVVTIGSTTTGKPFTSYGRTYCGSTLNAMQTESVNAVGVSVAGGIRADCSASDDIFQGFGSNEGMLSTALDYLQDGSCIVPSTIAARASAEAEASNPRYNENALYDQISE